ncbi:uncharacterized protein LOC144168618 [Haemaphysalis longicornis]
MRPQVIGLLILATVVLSCTLAANVLNMRTPMFVADPTTSAETAEGEYEFHPAPAPTASTLHAPEPHSAGLAAPEAPEEKGAEAEATQTPKPVAGKAAMLLTSTQADEEAYLLNGSVTERDPRCLEKPQMTLCSPSASRGPDFFFDGRQCLTPESVPPPGCLEGANRFRSFSHCRTACQVPGARAECREPVRLVACSVAHVTRRWFYPANGSCVEWAFPQGSCVSVALHLFRSMGQCLRDCVQHDAPACHEVPVAQPCVESQVHFPVYSSVSAGRLSECLMVDPSERRCLLGRNAFSSHGACARACLLRDELA